MKNQTRKAVWIVSIIALISAIMVMPAAAATTVTISPSDNDCSIREGQPNTPYDTTVISVCSEEEENNRGLIHFDLSSIPSGATIDSATLYLYMFWSDEVDRTYNVHRVTASWTEAGATWKYRDKDAGIDWATPGGDYVSTETASASSGAAYDVWVGWAVTSDVQAFVDGTSNHGWLIRDAIEDDDDVFPCVSFTPSEGPEANWPKLVVTYTPPCGCVGATKTFRCGEAVTESCVFNCNLSCPTGKGLVVDADNIVINGYNSTLNQYFVLDGVTPGDECTGSGTARTGIYNFGHDNVVIKNLNVTNFCNGMFLKGDEDTHVVNNTIENCRVYDNGRNVAGVKSSGIKMSFVYESTIENCKIYNNTGGEGCTPPCENGGSGIFMYAGNDNVITNNDIYDNKKGGFFCKAKPMRTEISHNEVWGNHQGGIILRCKCTQNSTIEYNNVSYNYGTGIFIGGPCNTIRHNNVSNNMNGSIETLPDTGHNGCGVNFGRDDTSPGCGPGGSCGSRLNTLINNTICDNEYLDIWERAAVRGTNNGVENKCDEPDGWNDDGTTGCTYPCVVLKSDLVIQDKSETWINETHFNVSYKVCNIGEGDADASEATLYVDGTDVEHQDTSALAAGACTDEMTFDTEVECLCGETVNITVCADNGEVIDESDETNNCEVNMVECPPCAKPDLVIEKTASWSDGTLRVDYTITNQGGTNAGESTMCVYVDGERIMGCDNTVSGLAAGASETGTTSCSVDCPCGTSINVTACADCNDAVDEGNEANNCEVNMVECPPCPTPTPTPTPGPTATIDTATGTGSATLETTGGQFEDVGAVAVESLPEEGKPHHVMFPHGLFSFRIGGLSPGQSVTVRIVLPSDVPTDTEYWKFGPTPDDTTPHWYQLIPLGDNDGDNVLEITLIDGGLGDDDLTADGVIIDQGGPCNPPVPPVPVPEFSAIGLIGLIGVLSALLAVTTMGRRKRR
jgi:hypothetical protein